MSVNLFIWFNVCFGVLFRLVCGLRCWLWILVVGACCVLVFAFLGSLWRGVWWLPGCLVL